MLPVLDKDPVCNRCGRCCYYQDPHSGSWKKCKNLVQIGSRSSCRIWGQNFGVEIEPGVFCRQMSEVNKTYVGCPYNPGAPLIRIPIAPFND